MCRGPYAPWDHYPKSLRLEEVQRPVLVIEDFFDAGYLDEQCRVLQSWRYYIVNDDFYKDEHGPGSLLFTYDLNVRLIEAMHLLFLNPDGLPEIGNMDETDRRIEQDTWARFLNHIPGELNDWIKR